ncbi:MAG: ABC transporter ATP-binding protein/permease [Candidatus Adiutrix sp.]|jgi:subfamily B ATP-binding cassette protein MsbA|nr:ABC transporter ATP-binding protein/permease [Candidatus Adiutrix sp.]
MSQYLKLFAFVRPYRARLIVSVICLLGASGSHLALPLLIRDIINDVLIAKDMRMLNVISLTVLAIFILRGFFVYGQQYLMEYVAQRVVFDLRNRLFNVMVRLRGLAYFEKNRTGGLMSYYANDIGALQNAIVGPGVDFIRESFILAGSVALMLTLHWKLSLVLFISGPLVAFAIKKIGRRIKAASRDVLGQLHEFTAILQETLGGIRVVKSFAREDHEAKRFAGQTLENFNAVMRAAKANALLTPIVEFLATVGVVFLIWYGGSEVVNGRMDAGALVAFLTLAINLSNPIKRLSRAYGSLQQALAAGERVFEAMEFDPEVKDAEAAPDMPAISGNVDFNQVGFAYNEGEPVIADLNFKVKSGQMAALVGHSGAGKTTLVNLIMRFYDVSSGALLIDGLDVRTVTQRSLREQVGIVPQETLLFSGSIRENIRYGRLDATDAEVEAAARAANVAEFVNNFPGGYDTLVGERGASLSGGQRQRVAIARAILKNPRILILDEATSALDTESEKLVRDALEALLRGRTSFVIAHRLSTIVKADVIMVLDHGRLAEYGPHRELLEKGGLYAKLYQTQFSHANRA